MAEDGSKKYGLALVVFIVLSYGASAMGALFSPNARLPEDWYANLNRPSFSPPAWVFGPVWTALYGMIGVAGWLIWRRHRTAPTSATFQGLALWGVQYVLNASWSPVFFGMHRIAWALGIIALMWVAVALSTFRFFTVSGWAGALFVPYWLWLSFATALNAEFYRLNG
jgi:tryptophan-rich sensory protein